MTEGNVDLHVDVERVAMTWQKTIVRALFTAAVFGLVAGPAVADPPPWAHGRLRSMPFDAARSHATVSGTIVGIDYADASILVATPHGRVPIAVTPSTSIFRGPGFASFAELGRGAHVDVDVSDVGGRLVAQIIRIR